MKAGLKVLINKYIPIYNRLEKAEIALLHCKDCIENINRCQDKFPLWLPAQEDQEDGVWHLDLSKYLKDGRINWPAVKILVNKSHE